MTDQPHRTIRVNAPSRAYDVRIGRGVIDSIADSLRAALPHIPGAVHLFVDSGLSPAQTASPIISLTAAGLRVSTTSITPTEEDKSGQTLNRMVQALTSARLERRDVVLALGGGIVGDLAGFAAATYRRGVPWINCPTTLLSMVDASVGGKTGANVRIGNDLKKNMIGAFWQPSLVLADVSLLGTLPERIFRAGLAECIKHGLLSADFGDAELLHWTKSNLGPILARDPAILTELVGRNVAIKAAVVGTDEREEAEDRTGGRALLNLGHTFGHAIETMPGLSPTANPKDAPLQHGEAVAIGMVCAARAAELLKLMPTGFVDELRTLLGHAGLPVKAHGLAEKHTPADVLTAMGDDKKVIGGKMRLILPRGEGRCTVVADAPREVVVQAVEAIAG